MASLHTALEGKGSGPAETAERPFGVTEVFQLAVAVPARFRVFILRATFTTAAAASSPHCNARASTSNGAPSP
ncbi:hypothetical protein AB0D99_22665 [Streptomyces sp. NPDC047971]|uniref:hypothetical protein n=1 Tax=Streptomyces sp. NPDC047971 TaxID=3154499 RepID=UPI0033F2FF12